MTKTSLPALRGLSELLQRYPFSRGFWEREIQEGRLRALRISDRIMIRDEDFLHWLEGREYSGKDPSRVARGRKGGRPRKDRAS